MFTTGDFAALCRTTRDTLYHYDEIGLLRPERVEANGYRLYSLTQFKEYQLIELLRMIDMPLAEIRTLIRSRTSDTVREQLQQKRWEIDRRIEELRWEQRTIDYYVESSRYAEVAAYDEPRLERRPHAYIAVSDLPERQNWTARTFMRAIRNHFELCNRHSQIDHVPIGWINPQECALRGDYLERYCFSHMSEPLEESFCWEQPEGLYAVLVHKGDDLDGQAERILAFLAEKRMEVCGDVYVTEMVNFFNVRGRESYVREIAVPVREIKPSDSDEKCRVASNMPFPL